MDELVNNIRNFPVSTHIENLRVVGYSVIYDFFPQDILERLHEIWFFDHTRERWGMHNCCFSLLVTLVSLAIFRQNL
jgi:hypothetical protein